LPVRLGEKLGYRDRIYIIKDIILKLVEYGELNVTSLVTYCGLNMQKHRYILDELELNGLVSSYEVVVGKKKTVTMFRPTRKGIEFCKDILEVYEQMFPRSSNEKKAEMDLMSKHMPQSSSTDTTHKSSD
jgi:predicted transcriptional regulator